jgi:NitT/TauT family transport system substrate-binding protein
LSVFDKSWLRRAILRVAVLVPAVLVLPVLVLALGLAAAPAAAQVPVKFSLNWKFEGPATPFVVALDKGYFGAEGLDVSIEPGTGALEVFTRVASGAYDMGVGDISALMKFRDQNPTAPIAAVFMVQDKPAFSIVGRKSRGVALPHDLEGKKLGAPAADPAFAQWPIFWRANGIDPAKVTILNVGPPLREPMLASGEVDAFTGISYSSFINLRDRGVQVDDITVLLMADYGVNLYGDAVLVNTKFAAEKPETVKAFLKAFVRGLKSTAKNPAAAVDHAVRRNEDAKKETELERLQLWLAQNVLTPDAKARGVGGIDPARLAGSIDQIGLAYQFKSKAKATDVFDPGFLPPEFDRRFE